uniref:hypothetical protein n=1 Tax=Burkholderia arboris TaxID=488730 RepID=UPI003BEF4490
MEAGSNALVDTRARHAEYSVLRERIVEHIFVGEAMRRLWQLGVLNVEILRAEFDSSGYDLVMCCGSVMRHIQFKVSLVDGSRGQVTINQRLAHAPSGCVVWLGTMPISSKPCVAGFLVRLSALVARWRIGLKVLFVTLTKDLSWPVGKGLALQLIANLVSYRVREGGAG